MEYLTMLYNIIATKTRDLVVQKRLADAKSK